MTSPLCLAHANFDSLEVALQKKTQKNLTDMSEKQQVERVLRGHTNWVYAVKWSCDGQWLASCSTDHTVRIWSATIDSDGNGDAGDANSIFHHHLFPPPHGARDTPVCDAAVSNGRGAWDRASSSNGDASAVLQGGGAAVRNTTAGKLQIHPGDAWSWQTCGVLLGHAKPGARATCPLIATLR